MSARGAGIARSLLAAVTVMAAAGCGDPAPAGAPAPLTAGVAPPGFPPGPLTALGPDDNRLDEERAQLGKRLFFEPRLSRTGQVSCGSCHHPEHAFADPHPVSAGVDGRQGTRNAPALVNLAWTETLFWDGRAASLEEQASKPIEDAQEMDLPLPEAVDRLAVDAGYRAAFDRAFAGPPTAERLQMALASFVRALVSGDSPYDRFLAGDHDALSPAAHRGEHLFFDDRSGCFHCHPAGPLTNDGYFNNGGFEEGGDVGRQKLTGRTGDLGKFRVPGLRNIAASAPYMHDGLLATLEAVVAHYARGGRGHPSTDPQIRPLDLTAAEQADLVAFLRALSDEGFLGDPRYRP